jgi:ABC-type phosphate/phosphonate transport system substrate-binding protein
MRISLIRKNEVLRPKKALYLLLIAMLFLMPCHVLAEQGSDMPKVLRMGFLQKVFFDMDPRDAKAAMEVQGREISAALGLNTTPQVMVYADMTGMTDAVRRGGLEMVSMPSIEYLRLRKKIPLIPAFVGTNIKGQGFRYLIVSRKDSGINTFTDLKGKTILAPSNSRHELSHLWLEVLLMRSGRSDRNKYFRQVKESQKASNGIMGVFFRQADAAIVTSSALETAQKLNPQLEKQLQVIEQSGNLSDGVACLLPSSSERFRRSLVDVVIRLNESARGRQLFAMFQSNGVTTFKAEYLHGLEELIQEHERLKLKKNKRV